MQSRAQMVSSNISAIITFENVPGAAVLARASKHEFRPYSHTLLSHVPSLHTRRPRAPSHNTTRYCLSAHSSNTCMYVKSRLPTKNRWRAIEIHLSDRKCNVPSLGTVHESFFRHSSEVKVQQAGGHGGTSVDSPLCEHLTNYITMKSPKHDHGDTSLHRPCQRTSTRPRGDQRQDSACSGVAGAVACPASGGDVGEGTPHQRLPTRDCVQQQRQQDCSQSAATRGLTTLQPNWFANQVGKHCGLQPPHGSPELRLPLRAVAGETQ